MIRSARFILLIAVSGLMVACASQRPGTASPASLVTGRVTAGPVSPGARPGGSATLAVVGATVEALRGNQVMATTYSDKAGRYKFRLRPGTYLIRARSDKYLSMRESRKVILTLGQRLTVNLVFDTGIS